MSETQDVYSLTELASISFECQHCKTELVFRADRPEGKGNPVTCPCCNLDVVGAPKLLAAYKALYAEAKGLGIVVKIHGPKTVKAL